jgi:peptide/nickel transport system substrate-binding protein
VKKVSILLAILLICAFVIAGCGSSSPATTVAPTTTTAAAKPAATTSGATQPAVTTAAPAVTTTAAPKPTGATPTASPTTGAKKTGGTLTWIAGSGPPGPIGYPPEVTGPSGVTPQISLQPLLKEMLDGSIQPNLISSYEVDTGAKDPSVTMHVQKGIKFHDGTDFNGQAVKWNLDLVKATPYYAAATAAWKSIELVDDATVRIHFTNWQNTLVRNLCDTMTYMVSPTAFNKNGIDWMRYNMVGTGPFIQDNYQRDVVLTGKKNPNYWETGKPLLDAYKYLFVSDELTAVALYKSGGGDVIQSSNPTILADLATTNNIISVYLGPTSLFADSANPESPWSNLKVRQAAEYAIDKEGMAKTFGYGYKSAYQFSTSASMAYDSTIAGRKYDVAKAKQLMIEAGYPSGFKTQIMAGPIFLNKDAVLAVQNFLSKIGIQAEAIFPASAAWSDISTNPWKNAIIFSSVNEWGNQNATFNYFLGAPPTINKSVIKPEGWKELLDASKATASPDPVMLKKMENMVYDNVMAIPMYYMANNFVFRTYVKDHGEGTRGQSNWHEPQNIWLDK